MYKDLNYYKDAFTSLNTNNNKGKELPAPHKPLLLLSIIDQIESGEIDSCRIYLTDSLAETFKNNTRKYFGKSMWFKPNIFMPYHHMGRESFWRLVPKQVSASNSTKSVSSAAAEPQAGFGVRTKNPSYTMNSMRKAYEYAMIDAELFELLQNESIRAQMRTLLIATYLAPHARRMPVLEAMALLGMVGSVIA